jgi:hypothetical protein
MQECKDSRAALPVHEDEGVERLVHDCMHCRLAHTDAAVVCVYLCREIELLEMNILRPNTLVA